MSHLGRPKGKRVEALRLDPVAERLADLAAVAYGVGAGLSSLIGNASHGTAAGAGG